MKHDLKPKIVGKSGKIKEVDVEPFTALPLIRQGNIDFAADVLNQIRMYQENHGVNTIPPELDPNACMRAANFYRTLSEDDVMGEQKADYIMEALYASQS